MTKNKLFIQNLYTYKQLSAEKREREKKKGKQQALVSAIGRKNKI